MQCIFNRRNNVSRLQLVFVFGWLSFRNETCMCTPCSADVHVFRERIKRIIGVAWRHGFDKPRMRRCLCTVKSINGLRILISKFQRISISLLTLHWPSLCPYRPNIFYGCTGKGSLNFDRMWVLRCFYDMFYCSHGNPLGFYAWKADSSR